MTPTQGEAVRALIAGVDDAAFKFENEDQWDFVDFGEMGKLLRQVAALLAVWEARHPQQADPYCPTHGDPLVCLACEADEDALPVWQRPRRVTPPRLRGEPERTDVERLRHQAISISEILHHAGIGPCTISEGVLEIVRQRDELREAQHPQQEEQAARSSAEFALRMVGALQHTEAVADCPHCNIGYLAKWTLDTLGPAPAQAAPPGPPDPPKRVKPAPSITPHPRSEATQTAAQGD